MFKRRATPFIGFLGQILFELLGSAFSLSERATTIVVTTVMVLASIALGGLGGVMAWRIFTKQVDLAAGVLALFFFAVSYVCARLASRGFRSLH